MPYRDLVSWGILLRNSGVRPRGVRFTKWHLLEGIVIK